ncbi:MAG TPA: helix-turn-helix domain-containing protein [Mycobacterium sp.]|nr:helix-turn-helix domain-containing protein [Mycobacterium sp.]
MSISPCAPVRVAPARSIAIAADGARLGESGLLEVPATQARVGRSVLDGALAVLDALAQADDGLGLTALARTTGLAKTSAYRLAEQLTSLDAVQRLGRRYYIGARIGRIGRRWEPVPILRQAGQAPVHDLAVRSGTMASLRILHEDRFRIICATAPQGRAYMLNPTDRESTARTATGRVLYAAQACGDVVLPDCWTPREWRLLRQSIREPHATVVDLQDAMPGVCCVSAPVWWPDGRCAGAVTALVQSPKVPPNLSHLVPRIARRIEGVLQ